MNQMIACGNATEIELKFTQSGKAIAVFSVAMKSKRGEETVTTWQKCEAWEQLAENLAETVMKGDRVLVVGRIKVDDYTDKDGNQKKGQPVLVCEEAGVSLRWSRKDN